MEQDHVPDELCVRLLPERFLTLAPDRGNDRGDVECLSIGVERVIQRVVADVTTQRDLDITVLPPAPFQDALKLPAEIAFDVKDDAGESACGISHISRGSMQWRSLNLLHRHAAISCPL